MRRIKCFHYLLVVIFIANLPFHVSAKEWRVALCYGKSSTEMDKKYREAISVTTANILRTADKDSQLHVKIRDCIKEPDLACYANEEAIFCREEPLASVIRVAAWLAAESAFIYQAKGGNESALNAVPELSWVDALLLADAERSNDDTLFTQIVEKIVKKRNLTSKEFNSIYSLVIDIYHHTNNRLEIDKENSTLVIGHQIYNNITQYAFAFLIGHEAYHFAANTCPIKSPSRVETKGIWNEIIKMQQGKGLYNDDIRMDIHELKADRCGFRWVEQKARELNSVNDSVINALSKRIAIDLLAAPILVGMQPKYSSITPGNNLPKIKIVDGYLYPQSRLILAASSLRLSEKKYPEVVRICNNTARAIVSIIQEAYSSYPESSGIIPDSVLAELAPGIEDAWNGAPWTADCFLCKLESEK